MKVIPITLREANAFVDEHHRHHKATQGCKFALGLLNGETLCGVAICGRPVSRYLDNGVTVQECKLGDKIYQADDVRIYESTISEITLTAKHTIFVTENIAFDERAIGNSIFLSYAEAEAHLSQPQ